MNKNLRVHTNINEDTVLNVNIGQDFDFLEVLSLKINQEDLYKLDKSNYGVIVGRVLANDAFGVPNAKISIFIPIEDEDVYRSEITAIYQFSTVRDLNNDNIRYNVLPNFKDDECYRNVGTFPSKRLVLDDNNVLEVFDKYYKYTTVTNNGGDYMFYGVPTGNTTVHVDIDLSDIGVLSQKPRDFYYKGYNETLFDNANQFKENTNLDNLTQIITQNHGVLVYPFFGDEEDDEVAITRCDIQIQYKFEPTCVFFGSLITDTYGSNIGHDCDPYEQLGENKNLITAQGTIEMIRKTIDGLTEEFQIQGNKLINGDGVWCYQIPMNLDYVGTDEFGNIVATDNPNKGIPTRCKARFRFTIEESDTDWSSRHRAKYLVPNNPMIDFNETSPILLNDNGSTFDKHYNFGSSTLDDDYRDLYWNCIYTVKNYIPRLQNSASVSTLSYTGLKASNYSNNLNPIPFNKARFRLRFGYKILCIVMTIVIYIVSVINNIITILNRVLCLPWPISECLFRFSCITFNEGLSEDSSETIVYAPGCGKYGRKYTSCDKKGKNSCRIVDEVDDLKDKIEQLLSQEYENVRLDFYNDWLNGCLYFPLWFWKKTKKKKYFFGLFRKRAINSFCQCDREWGSLSIIDTCTANINTKLIKQKGNSWHSRSETKKTIWGVIKDVVNKDNLSVYYYSCGVIPDKNIKDKKDFIRLFATDLILLGSFNNCDLNGYPKPYLNIPPTTANIPPIAPVKQIDYDTFDEEYHSAETITKISGMDWEHDPEKSGYRNGLIMGMDCSEITTITKTCINLNRLSELGVSSDITYQDWFKTGNTLKRHQFLNDGFITKTEIDDEETRGMFATLNHNGLHKLMFDKTTGYKVYDLHYVFPTNFDGRQKTEITKKYTDKKTLDTVDSEYLLFRFGGSNPIYYPNTNIYSKDEPNEFYLYNNSFYFYFGLNLGKTAIEKFNTMFNATCYKNNKFPFTIGIDKVAAASAAYDSNSEGHYNCAAKPKVSKFGVIDLTLTDIKKPYSYSLSFADGEEILHEEGLNLKKLVFGTYFNLTTGKYCVESEIKEAEKIKYEDSDGNIYFRHGEFRPFTRELEVDEVPYKITNGYYTLTITDYNGKSITETIQLMQPSISQNGESLNLGTKFIAKEDTVSGETNYSTPENIYCSNFSGQIILSSVIIDGEEYEIVNVGNLTSDTPSDEDDFVVKKDVVEIIDGVETVTTVYNKIHVTFSVDYFNVTNDLRKEEWNSFIKDACNNGFVNCNGTTVPTIVFEDGVLIFYVWIPGAYTITLGQYDCVNGEVSVTDNESGTMYNITNGENFEVFINDVSTNFITSPNLTTLKESIDSVYKFFNVNKEHILSSKEEPSDFYTFPNVATNKTLWDSYITYDTVEDDGKIYASNETKLDALIYKFQSIFNISNAVFFNNEKNNFIITTKGGNKTIIQDSYPSYDEMSNISIYFDDDGEINQENSVYRFWDIDSYGNITCDESHPNIVGSNYKAYNPISNTLSSENQNYIPYTRILHPSSNYGFNPLIVDNEWNNGNNGYGNYFATFTNNAGLGDFSTMTIQKFPGLAQPITLDGVNLLSYSHQDFNIVVEENSNILEKWYKTYFIDKRMSYKANVFTSTNIPLLDDENSSGSTSEWFGGRVYFQTTNGIQMAYDNNYNVIGFEDDNLEYVIDKEDYTSEDLTRDAKTYYNDNESCRRLFYSSDFILDFVKYDMRYGWYNKTIDDFWMNDGNYPSTLNEIISGTTYDNEDPKPFLVKNDYCVTSYDTYPFVQSLDLRNVPITNTFACKIENCSYDMTVDTEQVNNSEELEDTIITAATTNADSTEFSLNCSNFIIMDSTTSKENLKLGHFNLLCNSSWDGISLQVKPSFGRFSFSLGRDYSTEDFYYTTFRPKIKTFKNDDELSETLKKIKESGFEKDNDAFSVFDGYYAEMYNSTGADTSFEDLFEFNRQYFIVKDRNKILEQNGEDSNLVSKIKLKFEDENTKIISPITKWNNETSAYGINKGVDLGEVKYIMIFTGREYVPTNHDDNLENFIRLYDCNDVYSFETFNVSGINIDNSTISEEDCTFNLNFTINGQGLSKATNAFCSISYFDVSEYGNLYFDVDCSSTAIKHEDGITDVSIKITLPKNSYDLYKNFNLFFDISFVNDKNLIVGFTFRGKLSLENNQITEINGITVVE